MEEPKSLFGEEEPVEQTPEQKERDLLRAQYRSRLAERLKDPEFRKFEGFPIGTDEAILALSDPPYYTACPNPFIEEWLQENTKSYDPVSDDYHREPYAADVSEGRTDDIYGMHYYHTKVPYKAIMRYLLYYTQPGDIVHDGFCGTGQLGVACQMCADKEAVQSLGYPVQADGTVLDMLGNPFSRLGARKAVLNDLSPVASFITYNYNFPVDAVAFEKETKRLLAGLQAELGWMYETIHQDGRTGYINFVVWSEVFSCPYCSGKVEFVEEALDAATKRVKEKFLCPHCNAELTKDKLDRIIETYHDAYLKQIRHRITLAPTLINYSVGKQTFEKKVDESDLKILERIEALGMVDGAPDMRFPIEQMYHGSRLKPKGFEFVRDLYTIRTLRSLTYLWKKALVVEDARLQHALRFLLESHLINLSLQNRYRPEVSFPYNPLNGVYYVASMVNEPSPFIAYDNKMKKMIKAFRAMKFSTGNATVSCGSCANVLLPHESIDYLHTDPPFGANIPYSDLNFMIEAWHRVTTNSTLEAIIDKPKKKCLVDYQSLMTDCFRNYYRALKPGRWMTMVFHNSHNTVWNALQEAIAQAGFILADIRTLDRQAGSYRQVTASSVAQQDLILSCYKPRHDFEEKFKLVQGKPEGVIEFLRAHLSMLPVAPINKAGHLETVAERTRFLLFDRMLAYHLQRGARIPVSAAELYKLLDEQFAERDEMYFLPDQAARYDALKARGMETEQLSIFVRDEKSAVQWVRSRLTEQPQMLGDLTPKFMQELREWDSHEPRPELRDLLREYFIENAGTWRVPDPNNEKDLEALRHNALLKLFRDYVNAQVPLKVFRKEAVLEGFRHCWDTKQYGVIVGICEKIPDKILQEIHEFVQFYDIAKDLAPEQTEQMAFSWE
jgi:predicted RNA methylase